jgi:uncharacterized protein YbcC (UPF0753/DUF2309 family)
MLAKIANKCWKTLKRITTLEANFIFEENTATTDEILLFDSEVQTLIKPIAKVEIKFAKNTTNGNSERLAVANNSVGWLIKANNWGETRPEWGLAKKRRLYLGREN